MAADPTSLATIGCSRGPPPSSLADPATLQSPALQRRLPSCRRRSSDLTLPLPRSTGSRPLLLRAPKPSLPSVPHVPQVLNTFSSRTSPAWRYCLYPTLVAASADQPRWLGPARRGALVRFRSGPFHLCTARDTHPLVPAGCSPRTRMTAPAPCPFFDLSHADALPAAQLTLLHRRPAIHPPEPLPISTPPAPSGCPLGGRLPSVAFCHASPRCRPSSSSPPSAPSAHVHPLSSPAKAEFLRQSS